MAQPKEQARRKRAPASAAPTRRKSCFFCKEKVEEVDYKNYNQLRRYISEKGTPARVAELRKRETERARHEARSVEQGGEIAELLGKTVLRFEVKAGPTGALFGSVTPTDIADEIWRVRKVRVDRRKIDLHEPIKRIGRFEVPIDVFTDVRVDVKTLVVPEGGELPPEQDLEAEESVLGAMMLSPGAIGAVSEILDAGDFYRESHSKIYRAALALYAKGEPVDAITLVDELEERGELEDVGGRDRIGELAALVPATANAAHYARIVREMATLRGLIRAGQEIAELGWERPGEAQDLVDQAEQVVFELSQSRVTGEFAHIEGLLKESFERITALYEAGEEITGVPSGFRDIDRLTSGFQAGNLVIVAARPSMGKSALGLCIAANLALRHETPVALFTLEMSKSEVTQRLLCSEAKVESQRLRTGKLAADDWPRLTAACDKLAKAPVYVDDTGSITMMEIRSKARRVETKEAKPRPLLLDHNPPLTTRPTGEQPGP